MAANAPTTPKPSTWRDWMPAGAPEPEELLTRDELLARLKAWRVDATEADLRFWEYSGVLPRPIRRWHNGAVRALYPDWFPHLVRELRRLQRREGLTLGEIATRLLVHARISLALSTDATDEEIRASRNYPQTPEDITLWPTLVEDLERLARWWEHLSGASTDRVEVHVVGTNGRATKYPLPIAPHRGEEEELMRDNSQ